ncbi:MAG: V-type ATP synthase subunit I [Fastidiosipilaceae bacterium]|jgi:V/A-type H+-transporting ATPase subunit I
MAIIKMHRFTLTAFEEDRDSILEQLMHMEYVHFTDLTAEELPDQSIIQPERRPAELSEVNERLNELSAVIALLQERTSRPSGLAAFNTALPEITYDDCERQAAALKLNPISHGIRQITKAMRANNEEISALKLQNRTLSSYRKLDVPFDELAEMRHVRAQYGYMPKRWKDQFEKDILDLEMTYKEDLAFDEQNVYLLLLSASNDREPLDEAIRRNSFTEETFRSTKTPSDMIAENTARIKELEESNLQSDAQLADIANRHLDSFKLLYESLQNSKVRLESHDLTLRTQRLILLEGYVPFDSVDLLESGCAAACVEPYDLDVREVARDDSQVEEVPVLLRNNAVVRPFESIIETFSTPRYDEVDPTPLMMPWYCLTFGMMMGDLGYGVVILLLTTLALKLFKLKDGTRDFLRFFQILSIPTIIAGACYGSLFATSIPGLINPTEQYMEMLILSIVIGLLMLFFGLGVKAYIAIRDGDPLGAVYDALSWYLLLIGGIFLLAGDTLGLPPILKVIGKWMMLLGALLVIFFSARDEKHFGPRLGWGMYNLYGISSWVGDLVSYTRIAALALSGAFIGYAVNLISNMVMGSGVIGFVAGLIILVIFHAFNLFLSGLSGYVHSMRLVYVEFFGKFFEGGGVTFKRFRAENKYLKVK